MGVRRVIGCLAFAALIVAATPGATLASFPGGNGGFAVHEFDDLRPADERSSVWVVPADGSDREQLTFGYSPSWSPDGSTLAFVRSDGIVTIPASGGPATNVAPQGSTPEFSPGGDEIVYANGKAIRIVTTDSTDDRKVLKARGDAGVHDPTYTPNGKRLVFGGQPTTEKPGLWSVRTDGTGLRRLTKHSERGKSDADPDVSPDGKRIVFERRWGSSGIAMMRADGSEERLLQGTFFLFEPVFAPTGDRIATIRMEWDPYKRACGRMIVTTDLSGGDQENISPGACMHSVSWQPLP